MMMMMMMMMMIGLNNNNDVVIAFSKPAFHSVGWGPVARHSMWVLFRQSQRRNQRFSLGVGRGRRGLTLKLCKIYVWF